MRQGSSQQGPLRNVLNAEGLGRVLGSSPALFY